MLIRLILRGSCMSHVQKRSVLICRPQYQWSQVCEIFTIGQRENVVSLIIYFLAFTWFLYYEYQLSLHLDVF